MSTTPVHLFLSLAKASAVLTRTFDSRLGGLGLTEYLILHTLVGAEDETMRRTDLATEIGLTASGVTRLLLPMEKIGLVKRVTNDSDARVSAVRIAVGGRRKLAEAQERMELIAEELLDAIPKKEIDAHTAFLQHLANL